MMMQQAVIESKAGVQQQVSALIELVEAGVGSGEAAHIMERSLFQQLLKVGHMLLSLYFQLQGDGDLGARAPMADGSEARRLDQPRTRCYLSPFGEHELTRYVYGSREDQHIEYLPLDDRLQLPESKFSYLVQDWSQSLAAEMSCSQVRQVLNSMLNLDIGVCSLERITTNFCGDAELYWDHSPAVASAKGTFIVATADGKGVPIRKGASRAPIVDHDPGKNHQRIAKRWPCWARSMTASPIYAHPNSCACCGQAFSDEQHGIAYTAFDQLDIQWGDPDRPGIAVANTRHVYYEAECHCRHTTCEAPCRQPPDELLERVELSQWRLVGPGLAALIVCLFYRIRLSRQRIREFLHDWFGIMLSVGTINKVIHESGRAAMPVEDELVSELRQSTLAYMDETSWHERMRLLWLWVFVSATAVVYWIAHRTEELIKTVLGEQAYKGWLMSDGYTVYRQFLKRLRCWAHLLRKARGLVESLDRPTQDFGKKTLELLHTLMEAVKNAREKPPDQALSQLYQEQLDDYRRACERVEASAPTEKARKLAVEMLSDWDVIFTILENPHLPLTNNQAERALRHCVILRRISHGTKTHQGSRIFAILASVVETCRLRSCSPWRYPEAVITAGRAGLPAMLLT